MGAALKTCKKFVLDDAETSQAAPSDSYFGPVDGPVLRLRVDWNPIRASSGTWVCPFSLTDEILVEALDVQPRGWEPLRWRHQRYKKDVDGESGPAKAAAGSRFSVPKHSVRVRVGRAWYMLQAAVLPEDRTMANAMVDIIDSKDTAAFVNHFNGHVRRTAQGADADKDSRDDQGPLVRVCAPIACCVLETAIPQLAGTTVGEVVTLAPYSAMEVNKFVYDGSQEFLEVPQALFHFAAWLSGGRDLLYDLQGTEGEDGEVLLIDPCVLRTPKVGIKDLFKRGADAKAGEPGDFMGPTPERFDQLHVHCGPLCKTFDPERRGPKARKVCGLDVKCGLRK
mmetsp:Transcript_5250/g.15512  ORF Transcript_5250/g.15512 Transcript_5250/m.15512 type:complete len:338 (-) Transcript_5250:129-1142(-)